MKKLFLLPIFFLFLSLSYSQTVTELRRFSAPNATQAVAVDRLHFYTISNSKIIKRKKEDGSVVKEWEGSLQHLNSGIIFDGKLYCSNTNYPIIPMGSSLEIFDTETLEHIGNHSFGHFVGSFTWLEKRGADYFLMFVHYGHHAQERGKGVAYTTLIRTDSLFRRTAGWMIPTELVDHLKPMSISGGFMQEDGTMFLSPHHFEELYLFRFPKMGFTLEWTKTIPVPFQGQGIARDPYRNSIWGIHRENREVIEIRITNE